MNILEKGSVSLAIMIGCIFLLTSCGDVQSERMSPGVTGSAVSVSAIAEEKESDKQEEKEPDTQIEDEKIEDATIYGTCPTAELALKKMNYDVTETKLLVPGYSTYIYAKNNSEVIADDWRSQLMDPPTTSFALTSNGWKTQKTAFDVMREKKKNNMSVSHVVHRDNGDYVFVGGMTCLVRVTEAGKIKYKVSAEQLFSEERILSSMAYLGDGKAIVQSQDTYFDTNVYEYQDTSIVHLDLVDIKAGKVIQSYMNEWRLCGAIDDNYFFAEKDKKINKVEVNSGEIVKKYATEAIWSQGWSDEVVDDEGIFFHDYPITWCTYNGKLYAKHVGGVFQLDEEEPCWKQLISREDNFTMGPMYNNSLVMQGENRMVMMANRCDDECATDCYIYEWK